MGSLDLQERERLVEALSITARAFEREADEALFGSIEAYAENPLAGLPEEAQKLADRAQRQLTKALRSREEADDQALWKDYLDAGYAELFLGVSTDPIAPFESVYRSTEKTLYSKQYFAIADLMKEVGFAKPQDFAEPEDHLAMELALYVKLNRDADAAAKRGDEQEARQLFAFAQVLKEDHLDKWVGQACDDLIAHDDSNGFYSGMANLAKAVLLVL
ncbi:TorD/DmsD family molecular chaperone [Xiamenia xianingshaonis]|uniref:Molecular chaperone TorD family protein n=1 Tax=Xiamenia xianingshaonis TaxID=2682776 RepID=A0A9E6MQS1_9ACTN|nr:molecular chaperone TorD family protein [Xiamenia xianingshaonis]NHM13371.1 hypothetical protein [Xiamenia xianingshaonis]QTU84551.1 molecular chaperone TorD family protein [Xiamenia xianingshaonis]